jgi:hypothetical protein
MRTDGPTFDIRGYYSVPELHSHWHCCWISSYEQTVCLSVQILEAIRFFMLQKTEENAMFNLGTST